jgi:hypothetical protein
MYHRGEGVQNDMKKAINCKTGWDDTILYGMRKIWSTHNIIIAANLGHDDSLKRLREMFKRGL